MKNWIWKRISLALVFCFLISCMMSWKVLASGESAGYAAFAAAAVSEGSDCSFLLGEEGNPAFGLRALPELENPDGTKELWVGEQFSNGMQPYVVYDPAAENADHYGLLSYDGRVLTQPEYRDIYTLERCRGSLGAVTAREELPNILILVDETYRFQIFRCSGAEPELLEDRYDLVGSLDWEIVSSLTPGDRAETIRLRNDFYENFIPVYRDGEGYGIIGFDGESLIPCAYDSYRIVSPTRIAMYQTNGNGDRICHLYDTEGKLLSSGPYSLSSFREGLAAAEYADGTIRYLSENGSSAFTLREYQMPAAYAPADFSDGLVMIHSAEDPAYPYGSQYTAYLDRNGSEALSLREFEETFGASIRHASDFSNGIAYLTDTEDDAYVLTTAGEVRPLKHRPYYGFFGHNGYALVDTDGDEICDNVMNKWGSCLFTGSYTVRYCSEALLTSEKNDCHWVAITNNTSGLTSYLNLDTKYRTDFLYTDSSYSDLVTVYQDTQYLRVVRDGKHGVLGEDAKELVPAVYDMVHMPEGRRAHFTALRKTALYGYQVPRITLYDTEGKLLGVNDQYDQKSGNNAAPADSGFGYLYSNEDAAYVIITPEGETRLPQKDCYGLGGSAFSGGLLKAEYYSSENAGYYYGFLTENGTFLPLTDAENYQLPVPFENEAVGMEYGSCVVGQYLLYYKDWVPDHFLTVDRPSSEGELSLVQSYPENGQNYISRALDTITLEFNQEILLQDPSAIHLDCDLGEMTFHACAKGNTLILYPDTTFYTGEVYTLTMEDTALSAANSSGQISYFAGAEIQYKITGVSSKTLLTDHPEYLSSPESIDFIYQNANLSLEKMLDAYCGKNENGEMLSAFFYAAKNLDRLTADKLCELFGGNGTKERMQKNLLNLFISRACVDSAVTLDEEQYQKIKQYLNFCKGWDELEYGMKITEGIEKGVFEPAARENGAIDPLRDTFDSLMMEDIRTILNFCTSHADALESAWNARQSLEELRGMTMDDLLSEYSLTLFTYVHMNRSAIDSLLRTLSPDSELYKGLEERMEALSGDALSRYLEEQIWDQMFTTFVSESAELVFKLTGKGGMKAMNYCVDIAEKLYQSVTGKSEVDQYIQVIMLSGHAQAVSSAVQQVQLEMLRSVQAHGETTAQQRQDLNVAISIKQQAYALLMEMAAELDSKSGMLSRDCLIWAEEIMENCAFPEYLELCKADAAHLAANEVFPEERAVWRLRYAEPLDHKMPVPETYYMEDGRPVTQIVYRTEEDPESYADRDDLRRAVVTGAGRIGEGAFAGCDQLTSVLLGNVTAIGSRAFADCAITRITIPETVTEIAADAFSGTPLVLVAGTTEFAREFARSVHAEYLDLNTTPILVIRAGYDEAGKLLFASFHENAAAEPAAAKEVLFFLVNDSFAPFVEPLPLK